MRQVAAKYEPVYAIFDDGVRYGVVAACGFKNNTSPLPRKELVRLFQSVGSEGNRFFARAFYSERSFYYNVCVVVHIDFSTGLNSKRFAFIYYQRIVNDVWYFCRKCLRIHSHTFEVYHVLPPSGENHFALCGIVVKEKFFFVEECCVNVLARKFRLHKNKNTIATCYVNILNRWTL